MGQTLDSLLAPKRQGRLFILSGPAGSGKNTLVSRLREESALIDESVSYTTRPPRPNEENERDYHFVTRVDFERRVSEGVFLEHVLLYGHYYGTSKVEVEQRLARGHHVFLVIDTQGALKLKGQIPATLIFVAPPSIDELKIRLLKRKTETHDSIERRLAWAKNEMKKWREYDYLIENDDVDQAYEILKSVVIAEAHRCQS